MKKFFNVPEISLIGLGIFWITENYLISGRISYVTLLVTWLLFLQVFYKNRLCGLLYGSALAIISGYKFYDTFGNAIGMEQLTFDIAKLFIVFGIGLLMSVVMFYKYIKAKEKYEQSVLTMTTH